VHLNGSLTKLYVWIFKLIVCHFTHSTFVVLVYNKQAFITTDSLVVEYTY